MTRFHLAALLTLAALPGLADTPAATITAPKDIAWLPMIPEMGDAGPSMATVFGEPGTLGKPYGGLFRVPAGGVSPSHTHSSDYWAVMLQGTESVRIAASDAARPIPSGSHWAQPGKAAHVNECLGEVDCLFFVYYPDGMDYLPTGQ